MPLLPDSMMISFVMKQHFEQCCVEWIVLKIVPTLFLNLKLFTFKWNNKHNQKFMNVVVSPPQIWMCEVESIISYRSKNQGQINFSSIFRLEVKKNKTCDGHVRLFLFGRKDLFWNQSQTSIYLNFLFNIDDVFRSIIVWFISPHNMSCLEHVSLIKMKLFCFRARSLKEETHQSSRDCLLAGFQHFNQRSQWVIYTQSAF